MGGGGGREQKRKEKKRDGKSKAETDSPEETDL
jgi:hypothetical protein